MWKVINEKFQGDINSCPSKEAGLKIFLGQQGGCENTKHHSAPPSR